MTRPETAPPHYNSSMDPNPYEAPEHYAVPPRRNSIPWTAYVAVIGAITVGVLMVFYGLRFGSSRLALGGLFVLAVGLTGAYFLKKHRQTGGDVIANKRPE